MRKVDNAPKGAVLYEGLGNAALADVLAEELEAAKDHGFSGAKMAPSWFASTMSFEESGSSSPYWGYELCPQIDGYEWYRGYRVVPAEASWGAILLLTPWIRSQESRPAIVLTIGEVPDEVVERIIAEYVRGVRLCIEIAVTLAGMG